MTSEHEKKTCDNAQLEVKRLDSGSGEISGYASVFDVLDSDGDVVRKGAYAKTIQENIAAGKVSLMIKHMANGGDLAQSIGVIREAKEDDYGLWFRAELFSTEEAQEARVKVDEGKSAIGASIGYRVVNAKAKTLPNGKKGRDLLEIVLYEVTLTLVPACRETVGTLQAKDQILAALAKIEGRVDELESQIKRESTEQEAGTTGNPTSAQSAELAQSEAVAALQRRNRLASLRRLYNG